MPGPGDRASLDDVCTPTMRALQVRPVMLNGQRDAPARLMKRLMCVAVDSNRLVPCVRGHAGLRSGRCDYPTDQTGMAAVLRARTRFLEEPNNLAIPDDEEMDGTEGSQSRSRLCGRT